MKAAAAFCSLVLIASSLFSGEKKPEPKPFVDPLGAWNEEKGKDGRMQAMLDRAQCYAASMQLEKDPVLKALVIRVGDKGEATYCFDTELLRAAGAWTGGLLKIDPQRYGLIKLPVPPGPVLHTNQFSAGWAKENNFADPRTGRLGPLPREWGRYSGHYRHGNKTVLAYRVLDANVLELPWVETHDGIVAVTRTFELIAGKQELRAALAAASGASALRDIDGVKLAVIEDKDKVTAVAIAGSGMELIASGERIEGKVVPQESLHLSRTVSAVMKRALHGRLAKALVWSGAAADLQKFAALVKHSPPPIELEPLTKGGPAQFTEVLTTQGEIGKNDGPLAIDTIALPYENSYQALFFTSGVDFFSNGDAALSTVHGDVWRVSGIDKKLAKVSFKRMVTGLFQPLGVKIIDGKIHVICRDMLAVLHDLNGDNEIDYVENLNNEGHVTTNGHEYVTSLETDAAGNFYCVKSDSGGKTAHDGSVLRIAKDGSKLEVFATGFRNANGLGMGPDGTLTIAPQEGTWTPSSKIDIVKQGGFYGFVPSHHRETAPTDYDRPLCWLPKIIDNSCGGQVWVTNKKWGPLFGQMLHLSYGRCTLMLVLRDNVDGQAQGTAVPLPGRYLSGVMRGRFHPKDGNLYLTGLRGWQNGAVKDGCLQRVRYIENKNPLPVALAAHANGFKITFSEPLDREDAADPENFTAEQWNYRWTQAYGSADYSVADPEQKGRDTLEIKAASVSKDGKTLLLEIPNLKPAMQFKIEYNIQSKTGALLKNELYGTVHKLHPTAPPEGQ